MYAPSTFISDGSEEPISFLAVTFATIRSPVIKLKGGNYKVDILIWQNSEVSEFANS